ncbi:LysR family transcriptional regulator [Rhizobium sp. PRIMUS64]|uniref:LysR family transcriptional regulator n=1 Tax=Rhizobium sp. PRIMUS64 TaxID=2908925 RepID=UPI001FF3B3B5|nr:LysR family transcriptional regulator [Rhizobium sp. PRIMUS64]MCJ9691185.1 LysR family transcriptional regulator [Rhizobium sp. PRIMUS64]
MSRLGVPLSSLEIFAEAGQACSFKRAAERLALSTSAVSQAVRKLEERLDRRLFDRVGNRLKLTPEGEKLLKHVLHGFDEMRAGLRSIADIREDPISICSPPGIASQLLSVVVQSLLASKERDIRLVADEAPDFRSYRDFDIAVLYGEAAARLHNLESLGPDVFAPVCAAEVKHSLQSVGDLANMPLIVNETNAVTWAEWLDLNNVSLARTNWLRFNRASQIIPAVLSGLGVALESLRVLAPQLERGELVLCDLPGSKPISRELTFLHVTANPARVERATKVANLVRCQCRTALDGRRTARDQL